jgi:hypothetical protein
MSVVGACSGAQGKDHIGIVVAVYRMMIEGWTIAEAVTET